jgi:hypothetical protein
MPYDPDNYPHRNYNTKTGRRAPDVYLAQIQKDGIKSHPDGGDATTKGKDLSAFGALELAGRLTDAMAGWAVDHETGLALKGLSFVPLAPNKQHDEYIAARAAVDTHEHERAGAVANAKYNRDPSQVNPAVARQLLINLLRANPGGFPLWLQQMTLDALEGLKYGEPTPAMFQPAPNITAKVKLHEMRLQLRALCFVEFHVACGKKKFEVVKDVAGALCVEPSTLIGWAGRLRRGLGRLAVESQLVFSRNAASYVRARRDVHHHASRYDDAALGELANRYKAVKRDRKAHA